MEKKEWKLKRTKQCAKCPWKIDVNPYDIPGGYSLELHKNLKNTISKSLLGPVKAMACHLSEVGEESFCIGWLVNQLGPGNNISLRIKMLTCENSKDIEVFGDQHLTFEDTIPEE